MRQHRVLISAFRYLPPLEPCVEGARAVPLEPPYLRLTLVLPVSKASFQSAGSPDDQREKARDNDSKAGVAPQKSALLFGTLH